MNILHITDLHIDEPEGEKEALRAAFFPEYFESLIQKIRDDQINVDFIFVTGDIVNYAKVENYSHAFDVLNYLAEKLCVTIDNVFVINGNHDVIRSTGSLAEFNTFAKRFNESNNLLNKGNRFELYKVAENDAVLCLDSIGSSFNNGYSSPLGEITKDNIVKTVRDHKLNNLFVLSHHPAASYDTQNQAPFDEGDISWNEKHMWPDGGSLYKRLSSKATVNGMTFWFSGDVHRDEYSIIEGIRVLSVGSSLNVTTETTSAIQPQVHIVSVNNIDTYHQYKYNFLGHNKTGLEGEWDSKQVDALLVGKKHQIHPKQNKKITNAESNKTDTISALSIIRINLINEKLQEDIHNEIIKKNLYEFGRFDTSAKLTSLSWVSTQGLLGNYSLFSKVIKAFKGKIDELIPQEIKREHCLLVGVDLWGAILSSRLGAATNIRNCCIAVRSQRDSYDNVERINETLKNIVKGKKIIFVISDVISTGSSISTTYEKLKGAENSNWYNLAVLCDPSQDRSSCFENYTRTYYLCGSVKMPIVEKNKLPDLDMLGANISFLK
ncbi:MAG: metallophosphoesterase [Methylobacter sp.]|nr:metallophosphoesterase [Methylobacter sp.]